MAKAKWIGGFLGLFSGGTLGALAGFVLGALFDVVNDDGREGVVDEGGSYRSYDPAQDNTGGNRNGFLFSLLTLASYIIKADGKIMHSEMEAMRQFLRSNFGEVAVSQGEQIMLRLFERQKQMDAEQPGAYRQTIYECCAQLRHILNDSQLLQLFKLSMSVFARPVNIYNLVSYLQLPMSPIPAKLRYELTHVLLKNGGFGEKKERDDGQWRDDWENSIASFEFLDDKGKATPQAKAKKMPFLNVIRKPYDSGIPKEDLVDYISQLQEWVQGCNGLEVITEERVKQLHELSDLLSSFSTATASLPNLIAYDDIEKRLLQIYRPMNYALQQPERGSLNVINDVRCMAIPANTLVWLDCQAEDTEIDPYDFLHGQGTNFLRTGINIYVATDGCGNALGSPEIAKRARSFARRSSCGEYDLVENNCHKFTVRCVTGVTPSAAKLTDRDVAHTLKRTFGCERITWERTGASSVNFSFDD